MPGAVGNERFRQLRVERRGRLRAGSDNHASAWRLPYGCFSWRLDAGGERRRVRPRTRPGTWKGRTTRSSGSSASSTTGHGPSRRAGIPSPGRGATSGAAHRLTPTAPDPTFRCAATAPDPAFRCTAAGSPARSDAAARIPPGAGGTATSGHGTPADAAHRRPLAPKCTTRRGRASRTAARDAFAPIRGTPRPHRPLAAARAAIEIAEAGRRKGATRAAEDAAVADPAA